MVGSSQTSLGACVWCRHSPLVSLRAKGRIHMVEIHYGCTHWASGLHLQVHCVAGSFLTSQVVSGGMLQPAELPVCVVRSVTRIRASCSHCKETRDVAGTWHLRGTCNFAWRRDVPKGSTGLGEDAPCEDSIRTSSAAGSVCGASGTVIQSGRSGLISEAYVCDQHLLLDNDQKAYTDCVSIHQI